MIYSPLLDGDLAALNGCLDDPGTDLRGMLDELVRGLTAAVPSFLGLTVTMVLDEVTLTLTALDPELAITAHAWLALPLPSSAGRR